MKAVRHNRELKLSFWDASMWRPRQRAGLTFSDPKL